MKKFEIHNMAHASRYIDAENVEAAISWWYKERQLKGGEDVEAVYVSELDSDGRRISWYLIEKTTGRVK